MNDVIDTELADNNNDEGVVIFPIQLNTKSESKWAK